ncbi:MAG: lysylphosphatidylglycerol synthase transmembrane domain-containing protein [Phycisphaeraceae bacterium]
MKRHLALVLRLLLALAGGGYIVATLTWTDHATLPAGYELASGRTLAEPVRAEVVGELPTSPGAELTLRLPGELDGPGEVTAELEAVRVDPGLGTTLGRAEPGLLMLGLGLVALVPLLQAWRWLALMRARRLDPGYRQTLRLTLAGLFFNFCLPGTTGGDVARAWYAARHTRQRADAVMSIFFDRATGLTGLALLAALMGLTLLDRPRAGVLVGWIWLVLAGLVVLSAAYFSDRVRRLVRLDRLLGHLGETNLLVRIDRAALAYRDHVRVLVGAVAVSLPVHMCLMLGTALAGWALGMDAPMTLLLTVLPIVYLAGAVPISYQGLGVMEALAIALLPGPPEVTANQVVGMLMFGRLFLAVYALAGTVPLLRGQMHLFPAAHEPESEPAPQSPQMDAQRPTAG